jgi:hypothetical protein
MTTTNIARLQDRVRIAAPGATDGIIRLETYDVMKEFFARTDAWLFELPVYITQESNDYQVDTCQNAIVQRLMALERPRSPPPPNGPWPPAYLPMKPPQFLQVSQGSGEGSESQNPLYRTKRVGVLLNAGVKCPILRIDLNPNISETWIATLSLNICDPMSPDGFADPPDWIMEKWNSYITNGVICRLMLQPGKPYSSVVGAQYHGRKFNEGVGLARTEVVRMFTYGSQRWGFPQGWNTPRPKLPYSSTLL